MTAIAVLISADHRAFANLDPKPPIEPTIYLYVLPPAGVDYIAIEAGDIRRAIHLESPIGEGWHRVEVTGVTATTLKVWPLTIGETVNTPVVA